MTNNFDLSMERELTTKANELKQQRVKMLKNGVKLTLEDIVNKIEPHTSEITALMIGSIQKGKLQNLAASIIVGCSDSKVRVPALSEATDKTSPMWVYVGTHWEVVPHDQLFFDFIRDACRKMELSDEFIDDVLFFKKLKKQVELKLSRHTEPEENENVVLVNFINGTLEITRDGERHFRQHRREDYLRYVLPYPYDPQAECPRFEQFLDEVLPQRCLQKTILEYMAYCLVSWLHFEKILALLGKGSNGKSVLLKVVEYFFGKKNVAHESLTDLTTNESHRANIDGKIVNVGSENEGKINDAHFRTIASGEPVSARLYYSQPYTMTQYAKLIFAFNKMPNIKSGYANMRRWLLVKFEVHISEEQADPELSEKLAQELPGIMNMVLGVLPELLMRKRFSGNEALEQAVKELEIRNDAVLQFVEDRCETNTPTLTKGSELFKDFTEYCKQNNYNFMTNREFYRRLDEKYSSKMVNHQKAFNIRVVRYED